MRLEWYQDLTPFEHFVTYPDLGVRLASRIHMGRLIDGKQKNKTIVPLERTIAMPRTKRVMRLGASRATTQNETATATSPSNREALQVDARES